MASLQPVVEATVKKETWRTKTGVSFGKSGSGSVVISDVSANSLFEGTPLKAGYEVLSINDIPCQGCDPEDCAEIIREVEGILTIQVRETTNTAAPGSKDLEPGALIKGPSSSIEESTRGTAAVAKIDTRTVQGRPHQTALASIAIPSDTKRLEKREVDERVPINVTDVATLPSLDQPITTKRNGNSDSIRTSSLYPDLSALTNVAALAATSTYPTQSAFEYKVSLEEEELRAKEDQKSEKHEEEDLHCKPAAAPSFKLDSGTSLYPDISFLETTDKVSSDHFKEHESGESETNAQEESEEKSNQNEENSEETNEKKVKNHDESATCISHPHIATANLKQWPPPPGTSGELTVEEEAVKNLEGANNMPSLNTTPSAVMIPGIRATEPWTPNMEEEDPEFKSVLPGGEHGRPDDEDSDDDDDSNDSDEENSSEVSDDDGVIKATMVEDLPVPEAEAVSERGLKRRRQIVLGIAAFLVIGLAVGLAVGLSQSSDSTSTVFVDATPSPTAETPSPTSSPTATQRRTLDTVQETGVVRCGVVNRIGFSTVDPIDPDRRNGFDIDMCHAVAAAALGDPEAVEIIETGASERFTMLANGEVDLLSRVTTHTMERDVFEKNSRSAFSFAAIYLYDGLSFGGVPEFLACADALTTFGRCISMRICMLNGTTHVDALTDRLPDSVLVPVASRVEMYQGIRTGICNVIAAELFDVAEQVVRNGGYDGPYEVGTHLFSKEPLAMLVTGDPEWYDFVSWVFQALLISEEQSITMATANQFPMTMLFGPQYENMFQNAIGAVGNYGEIYQRHLEEIVPRSVLNSINRDGTTGLIYSFPFGGGISNEGPEPQEDSVMGELMERGKLRCGIIRRPGTGDLVTEIFEERWEGIDADYGRAVAAALFRRTDAEVLEFIEVSDNDAGLMALADGVVDVFAGGEVTFERDVLHPGTGQGFTFTVPYFYYPSNLVPSPIYGETLSLVTLQDDTRWADFVFWIVHATFYAEESQIDQSTSHLMPEVKLFGSNCISMFQDAIAAVGNYGEIYRRRVESIFPRSGTANMLNINPVGPQQYPLPGLF